jgi:3-hydroxyisobutyrate dehydrogenase
MTMRETSVRVGFIGIGNMGAPMTANLLARGFGVVVHDLHRPLAEPLETQGAVWADSPAAVAEGAAIICLSLPGPDEVEAVFRRPDGLLAALRPGSLVIDFTTNSPLLIRQLQAELAGSGSAVIDAPVSGGVTGARSRRLTVQVGGSAPDVERARPVLEAVAETVLHVGETGAGDTCKILHNCAVFCSNLATVECLTAGIKAGIDPRTLVEVFQKSGLGRNHDLNVALPARLFQGDFEPRFALKTALKDMGLATGLARAFEVPMPLAERCQMEMVEAVARGWGDRDDTIYLTLQEERSGVQVRLNGPAKQEPALSAQSSGPDSARRQDQRSRSHDG